MTPYDRIAQAFHARIDSIASAVDALAPGLHAAAGQTVEAVLSDQRILICACGIDAELGSYAARLLRSRSGDAPALPAIALSGAADDDARASLWRDLRTLAKDGDILLCIDSSEGAMLAREAIVVAAERNLCAQLLSQVPESTGSAIAIPVTARGEALRRELTLMALHTLSDLITELLMGEQ